MPKQTLTKAQFRQLVRLSQKLSRVLELDTNRDPATGVFKTGSAITAKALRAAWSTGGSTLRAPARPVKSAGEILKSQILAALRTPRPRK